MPNLVGKLTWADRDEPYIEVKLDATAVQFLLDYLPAKDDTVRQLKQALTTLEESKDRQ